MKGWFLKRVARSAERVITVSPAARDAIVRDLRVEPGRIDVVTLPVGGSRFDAIAARRRRAAFVPEALYLGRLAPHKNIRTLLRAFRTTTFARRGGRLVLVGGSRSERESLQKAGWAGQDGSVEVYGPCSEPELDARLARCQLLVMPSLEEGFGLPPFEAAAVGLPVAASRAGAMGELPSDNASFCDPHSEQSVAAAIDAAAAQAGVAPIYRHPGNLGFVLVSTIARSLPS